MEERHKSLFLNRLDRVCTHGVAEIDKEEIKLWFGQERVARRTWRQIADFWNEMIDDPDRLKLLVGGLEGSHWIFVWGEGVGTSEESFFQDVRFLAGRAQIDGKPLDLLGQAEAERDIDEPVSKAVSRKVMLG